MKMFKYLRVLLVVLVIAVLFVGPVLAKGLNQEGTPAAAVGAVDMAFLLAITGFFKTQFDLRDKKILGLKAGIFIALVVGLVLWYQPQISALHPIVAGLFAFGKWFLGSIGTYDLATDAGPRIMGNG